MPPAKPVKLSSLSSTPAQVVDKYSGLNKKQYIEVKSDEFKKQNPKITQKDMNAKTEGSWKEYSSKSGKNKI